MTVKRKLTKTKTRIVLDIEASIAKQFKFITHQKGSSMSWVLEKYIREYIARG